VKVRSILWNNRMKANEVLATGRLLWMQHRRPAGIPIEFQKTYPGSEPTRQPANPVILAQDEVLDEINAGKTTSSSQEPNTAQTPARDYPGGKLSGIPPAETGKNEVLSKPVAAPGEAPAAQASAAPDTTPDSAPLDVALAHTNEAAGKNEILLTEEIDQQVEHINQAPVLYRKTTPADTGTASPAVEPSWSAADKPAVVLREPAEAPAKTAPVPKGPAAPVQAAAKPPVVKEKQEEQPLPAQTPGIHVVVKGETLYGISRKYGITTDELRNWNSLGDLPLSIGQSLKVVAPAVTSSTTPLTSAGQPLAGSPGQAGAPKGGPATHTVSIGESMYQISRRYGVTIKEIMEWNRKADFNVIPGEKLLIKAVANSRE
jgi:membrane-bound lytic murein transglycosylase D